MPVTQLNTITLSEALDFGTNDFAVSSTASISVGDLIVAKNEAMEVQAIPLSGRVQVMRGVSGTIARPQANGQRCFTGTPDKFVAIQQSLTALGGNSGVYPQFLLPGQRASDGAGNEYILGDSTATIYSGSTVVFSNDGLWTISVLLGGVQGAVGVTVEESSSNQYTWVQVYGYNGFAQDGAATTDATSAYLACATTAASTPAVGLKATSFTTSPEYRIHGMFIAGVGSSAVTSATSSTGHAVPVFLDNPWTANFLESIASSNS